MSAAAHISTAQDPTASPRSAIDNSNSMTNGNGVTNYQSNASSHYHGQS